MGDLVEVPATGLRHICDPGSLGFETTAELPLLDEVLGQPRAVAALAFGASIDSQGFNLFALGPPGSGKTTLIRDYLERRAATEAVPPDLCYVRNFSDARRPLPLSLPPGRAVQLKHDVAALVDELQVAIPRAFDTNEYMQHRDRVLQELENSRAEAFTRMEQRAASSGFQLLKGPGGLMLAPAVAGKLVPEETLGQLGPEDRDRIGRARERLQREFEVQLRAVRGLEMGARDALRALDTETADYATRHIMEDLRARYQDQPAVIDYLTALQADVTAHVDDFRKTKETETPPPTVPPALPPEADNPLARYQVNVLVDNRGLKGTPVVVETSPTYHNLTGKIEHQTLWGGVVTNHTMIKAGALHRANGGYLIVPARECLLNPLAWEGLKRALKDGILRIAEAGAESGPVSTVTLDPEPVPLDVKVVLIGSPAIYYALQAHDEDFQKLFKVKADFTTRMTRTPDSERAYARFVNTIVQQEKTLPFDCGAVARIIEYGSRAVEDQDQLSTRFGDIADLVREAAHQAGRNSHCAATAADVRVAEEARRYRQNLLEERVRESLIDGTVLIDIEGAAVGRINALSVLGQGEYAFGCPVRLSASVAPGRGGVVSIEREVELSGPIHGKGILILSGYLLRKYGRTGPLSLSASLVFEQSYSMVEGDSASLAELCVLLSALAGVPLRQDVAVTGSVSQHGQVQAVGGVTEKIEGFFDLCRARGLSGTQGVLIPAANRRHVMLRDDIVQAVCLGRFHIWLASGVDSALELLTGSPAGEADPEGIYPEGTLHRAVVGRLSEYVAVLRASGGDADNLCVSPHAGSP